MPFSSDKVNLTAKNTEIELKEFFETIADG
jgi:hypothetical protein